MTRFALIGLVTRRRAARPDDERRPDFLHPRRAAANRRSLHRRPGQGRHVRTAAGDGAGVRREHGAHRHHQGADQDAAEDRSPSQPARSGDVSDVHRSDRDGQGEAVRPRHPPARQSRQDRRGRDPVDHDRLLAVQRRRLPEVVVLRDSGTRFRPTGATRATRWSPPPTPISTRSSKERRTWCRGATRAPAPRAARTRATVHRWTAAMSACRAA